VAQKRYRESQKRKMADTEDQVAELTAKLNALATEKVRQGQSLRRGCHGWVQWLQPLQGTEGELDAADVSGICEQRNATRQLPIAQPNLLCHRPPWRRATTCCRSCWP